MKKWLLLIAGGLSLSPSPAARGIAEEAALLPPQPFRISDMGFGGVAPAVAYNPDANQYLVVWSGNDTGEYEIYGQRIDASTGQEVGSDDFRITHIGPDGDGTRGAGSPTVAYNPAADEYLVVFLADPNPDYDGDVEVFAQRLSAAGANIGTPLPLTTTGPSSPISGMCYSTTVVTCPPSLWAVMDPAVVSNPNSNEYLVVYVTNVPSMTDRGTTESIAAVRLDAGGAPIATIGVAGRSWDHRTATYFRPALAHNPNDNEYAVVWGNYLFRDLSLGIWGLVARRLSATGAPLGYATVADFRPNGFLYQAIAHNPTRNEFIVLWDEGLLTRQLFGRLLSAALTPVGTYFGTGGAMEPQNPRATFDVLRNEFLVTWTAPSDSGLRTLKAQRLSDTADLLGGPVLIGRATGHPMGTVYGTRQGQHFIVWSGNESGAATEEIDVFGHRYAPPEATLVGLGAGGAGEFQVWHEPASALSRSTNTLPWPAYNSANGEVHPAMADLDGDGLHEIVMGLGRGGDGWMAIFDDAAHDNALLTWVQLPWPSYNAINGTIWPAAGDIDGDGKAEIVAGLGTGGEGFYAIFDDAAHGYALLTWRRINWPWYNATQSGETRPAVANIDGGSFSEIVIGLGPGGVGWMDVVDDAAAGFAHLRWLRVGWSDYIAGPGETYPAAGDVDGDGYDEIVVGLGANSRGWLQVFDDAFTGLVHKGWLQVNWSEYANANGETHPAVGDIDGDAAHEIVLGLGVFPGQGGWFEIRDDFTTSFTSLGWRNVGRGDFYIAGGATFPAIAHSR